MARKALEKRSYNFDISTRSREDGTRELTGRPIVYNSRTNLGPFDEIIDPGALDGTDLTDVRFLINHDLSRIPLARSRRNNGNSTMQLTPDTEGLSLDWVRLDVGNNADARALCSAVERGDISGMSIMFSIDGEKWDDLQSDHPTRHVTKIGSIVEVSACTFPAYTSTEISARSKEALENAKAVLERARELRAKSPEGDLELEKAKLEFISKM